MTTKKTLRAIVAALFVGVGAAAAVGVLSSPAVAQKVTTPAVAKPLQAAQAAANARNWSLALAKAKEAQGISGKTADEAYLINRLIASYATSAGDYPTALRAYDALLGSGRLTPSLRSQILTASMQIAYRSNNCGKVISIASEMGGSSSSQELVVQCHYRSGNYQSAARAAGNLIDSRISGGGRPDENWLQILLSSSFKLGDDNGRQRALELLVLYYGKPQYWSDLLKIAERQKGLTDRQNFYISYLRMKSGSLKKSEEYTTLAQLALIVGLPGASKTIVTEGFTKGVLSGERSQNLANMAKVETAKIETKLAQLAKEAAATPGGEDNVRLGEIYWSLGKHQQAVDQLEAGIKAGSLTNVDETRVILGVAQLDLSRRQEAVQTFSSVPRASQLSAIARLWTLYARRG